MLLLSLEVLTLSVQLSFALVLALALTFHLYLASTSPILLRLALVWSFTGSQWLITTGRAVMEGGIPSANRWVVRVV